MEYRAETVPLPGGGFAETGTITFQGKEFASGGAYATDTLAGGYPGFGGILRNWAGDSIGTWRAVASWPVRSYVGSRMYQIEAVINGRTYTGRGFGVSMFWRGKAKKGKARRVSRFSLA